MDNSVNNTKIKRLIAQGNRLEAMNIFLQSKFGETQKQDSNEKKQYDNSHERKKSQICQNISEEIDDNEMEANEGFNSSTNNGEDIAVLDVEAVDPLAVEEEITSSTMMCQTATAAPHTLYLDTIQHLQTSTQSDMRSTPQAIQQVPAQGIAVDHLPVSLQMCSSTFSSAAQQTMMSQQLTNHHQSPHLSCLIGDKLEEGIKVEEFPMLQEDTSLDGLVHKLDDDDIKVEEFPLWEDKNTDQYLQVREENFTINNTVSQRVDTLSSRRMNTIQLETFSLSDTTHTKSKNICKLKPITSQRKFSEVDKDANKGIDNEKYPECDLTESENNEAVNCGVIGNVPDNLQTSSKEVNEPINDESSNDEVTVIESLKTNLRPQKRYRDMILEAILCSPKSLNSKGISLISICKYIYENFDLGNENKKFVPQYIRAVIKNLLSSGNIIQSGDKFDVNLKPRKLYKCDTILEAIGRIGSSNNSKGASWVSIRKYVCENFVSGSAKFIKRDVNKFLSSGDIIKIGGMFKLPSMLSEVDKDENKSIDNEEKSPDYDYTDSDSENNENISDEDYRKGKADTIQSKEMELFKEEKEKILNEENYVDCPFKDCSLVVYGEHIQTHLEEHDSSNVTKNSIRKFECTECGKKTATFKTFANHMLFHLNKNIPKVPEDRVCNVCGYRSKRISTLKFHKCNNVNVVDENISEAIQSEEKAVTKQENYETTKKESIIDKDYKPSDDSDYHSSDSDMENSNSERQNMNDDFSNRIAKLKVACGTCNEEFGSEDKCNYHIENYHADMKHNCMLKELNAGAEYKLYLCLKCDKKYDNKITCQSHISRNHPEIKFYCDQCDFVSCKSYIKKHIQIIHENRQRSTCQICNKIYKCKGSLGTHMRNVHYNPEKLKGFLCETCGKHFKAKPHLNVHMLIHTGKKQFACTICNFKTVQKYNLTVHMRSHERKNKKLKKLNN